METNIHKPTVGIIGVGWVGKAMKEVFPEALVHDPYQGFVNEDAYKADVTFICVPTPNNKDGSLDTSIVEEEVKKCKNLIVVRSTVQPGTCDRLAKFGRRVVFQPEYLGETVAHPLLDEGERPFLIIGGRPEDRRQLIELYQRVYNANITIRQTSLYEAELIKITENRAISFKVAQCQELYDACEKAGVDYYTIRDAVYGDDPRFNLWFTFIYPDKRGFNSKCIPKDVYAWKAWAESVGYFPQLTRTLLQYNDELIRSNDA
jgi:UDPglucose 6-dehydrogenase